ncbi:MAG: hypothetical protein KatS3mg102_0606 [Planctomycetota bacterium]|nr:MAG: hypothetical protein KatS3mg102_0606 [Planctomycetota bacterium]
MPDATACHIGEWWLLPWSAAEAGSSAVARLVELVRTEWAVQLVLLLLAGSLALQAIAAIAARLKNREPTPRRLRAQARRLARRGEHARAADLYCAAGEAELAVEHYRLADLPHRAAEVLASRGHASAAAALYETAGLYEEAAALWREAGDLKRAELNYTRAGRKILAAQMYLKAGELAKAAVLFRELQKWDVAAELYDRLGRATEAAELYERVYHGVVAGLSLRSGMPVQNEARELEDKIVERYCRAGQRRRAFQFLVRTGRLERAAEMALQLGEADRAVDLFVRAGREDRAAAVLEKQGEMLRASRLRGELARRNRQYHSAARHYAQAGELRLAAQCYEEMGEYDLAAECYEKAGDPGQAAALHARKGRYDLASQLFEKAGRLHEALRCTETLGDERRRAELLQRMGHQVEAGECYLRLGQLEQAAACLRQVAPGAKDQARAQALLGLVHAQLGEHREALACLEAALAADGHGLPPAELHYARARALEALAERERAAAAYREVLRHDRAYRDAAERLEALAPPAAVAAVAPAGGGARAAAPGGDPAGARPGPAASGDEQDESPLETRRTQAFVEGERPPGAGFATRGEQRRNGFAQGRYRILEELGRGGMGVVYKCHDTLLDRMVAYKVLSSHIRDFPAAVECFLREAKSAARMNHPNIVTLFDFGESADGYYMTLEYVSGKNLRRYVREDKPDPETLRGILIGVCNGLAYAHGQNVIHRDIKPSNILVSDFDLMAKILDFGLAKVVEGVTQTASGVLGTPWYMSPEQVLGHKTDHRTDIYSLGVTLYEIFVGELPFKGRDFGFHHVHTPPPKPHEVKPTVSRELSELILRCLEKKPEDRFQSAAEIRGVLRAIPLFSHAAVR